MLHPGLVNLRQFFFLAFLPFSWLFATRWVMTNLRHDADETKKCKFVLNIAFVFF